MADTDKNPQFETLAGLQQAFWKNWTDTAEQLQSGMKLPWEQAAKSWAAWLPRPEYDTGRVAFESFARQGETFVKLCEDAARGATDTDEWLDRWLASMEQSFEMLPALFAPNKAFENTYAAHADNIKHLLGTPPLGFNREQQKQLQSLLAAQKSWQEANVHYSALLARLPAGTARRLRDKLTTGAGEGDTPVTSVRRLFDIWTDAAEEAFQELAFSGDYQRVYGELVNATMHLRQAVTSLAAPQLNAAGIATENELAQLSQELHRLRREVAELKAARREKPKPAQSTAKRSKRKTAKKAAKSTAKKAAKKRKARKSKRA